MKSYAQYCPIARAAEVFAERWTPIIIRNLHLGATTFSEIMAGAPGIPRSLLTARLDQLERAGIVDRRPKDQGRGWRYTLTDKGDELFDVCWHLGTWGAKWLQMRPEDYDPYLVLWSMTTDPPWDSIPERRVVVAFYFRDQPARHRYFWLLLDRGRAEVCVSDPGFEVDLAVTADARAFVDWHIGALSWRRAVEDGRVAIRGPVQLRRAFPTWNPRSHFLHVRPEPASREPAPLSG